MIPILLHEPWLLALWYTIYDVFPRDFSVCSVVCTCDSFSMISEITIHFVCFRIRLLEQLVPMISLFKILLRFTHGGDEWLWHILHLQCLSIYGLCFKYMTYSCLLHFSLGPHLWVLSNDNYKLLFNIISLILDPNTLVL